MDLFNTKFFPKAAIATVVTMIFDTIFHVLYTTPFEDALYFIVKGILGFIIHMIVFSLNQNEKSMTKRIIRSIVGTIVFTLSFSIYYRSLELLFGLPFGFRVPNIHIGGLNVIFEQQGVLSSIIWGIVHSLAFLVSSLVFQFLF